MNELTLSATLENVAKVTEFVDEQLESRGCSMKAQMQIDIAIDELFSNRRPCDHPRFRGWGPPCRYHSLY